MMAVSMKLVSMILVAPADARLQLNGQRPALGFSQKESRLSVGSPSPSGVHYGDSTCPCIGFDNIEGETILQVEQDGKEVELSYPADIGARCEPWDDERHFQCKDGEKPGSGKKWCAQAWCYVDPCNCDIDVLPKIASLYNTEATYRGKPLFWSYATCGGKDEFTKKLPQLGKPVCRCIGFAGVAGSTEISFKDGSKGEYPADLGATCSAWDKGRHPVCQGDKDKVPSWCKANWCYVDPCECDLPGDLVPKISAYLPEATFTGKNLYYSYETCGSADTWTEEFNVDACVNQDKEGDCTRLPRCAWTGARCLGTELVDHPLCVEAGKRMMEKIGKTGKEHSGSVATAVHWMVALTALRVMPLAAA